MDEKTTDVIEEAIFTGIFGVLYIIGVPLFIWRRSKEPIRSRGWLLAVLQITYCTFDLAVRMPMDTSPCLLRMINSMTTLPLWIYPYFVRSFVLWYRFRLQSMMLHEEVKSVRFRRLAWFQRNPWIFSPLAQSVFFFSLMILGACSAIGIYFININQLGDCWVPAEFHLVIIQAIIAILLLIVTIIFLWNVEDAYLIKHELSAILFVGVPMFIMWAVATTFSWKGGYSNALYVEILEITAVIVTIWMPLVGTWFFERVMRKPKKQNADDTSSYSSNQSLEDEFQFVMIDEATLPHFERFVISAWATENLLFHRRVERFKGMKEGQLAEEAKAIYDQFIVPGANCEINLDMALVQTIKKQIEDGNISPTLWDSAEKHCMDLLRYSVFPLWKNSPGFRDFLKKHKASDIMDLKMMRIGSLKKDQPRAHTQQPTSDVRVEMEHL